MYRRRKGSGESETKNEVIIVGLLPERGGLELLSWTLNALARPGDTIVALFVSIPFSTFLSVEVKAENGAQRQRKGPVQLQLADLRELCKNMQIQMDVKFSVGDIPEKVVIEQATAVNASIVVIGTRDRFVSWLKRSGGSYCVRNAPPGCSVVVVRNGKVMHFKDNPFKVLARTNAIAFTEGVQLLDQKPRSEEQILGDICGQDSHSFKMRENYRKTKCRQSQEQTDKSSAQGVFKRSSALCLGSDSSYSFSNCSSHSFSKKAQLTSHWEEGNGVKGFQWRRIAHLWKHRSICNLKMFPPRVVPRNYATNCSPLISDTVNKSSSFCTKYFSSEKESLPLMKRPSWQCFTFQELQSATCNFSPENFIGKGGYAEVYKGLLDNGELVAVKRLTRRRTEEQRVNDFLTEIGIIVHINHPNTSRLIGFGVEGGLHLVFEFSPYGSLASLLHGTKSQLLDCNVRFKVALGTAQGLLYLHEQCKRRIIHRDIKASNILLTENFEPQISDFGLAKWLPKEWKHLIITPIEGTFGHLAPEYFMHGIVDEKTDVFAFGVLLLELISGRLPIDSSQQSLVIWAKPLLESKNIQELIDPRLGKAYNVHQMTLMALTAALCVQQAATLRPSMQQVLQLLNGEGENLESSASWTVPLSHSPYVQEESLDTEEYTSMCYLTDLNRHREVALQF